MKQFKLWVALMAILIFLVACGGQETPTPLPTLAPTAAPVQEPTVTDYAYRGTSRRAHDYGRTCSCITSGYD